MIHRVLRLGIINYYFTGEQVYSIRERVWPNAVYFYLIAENSTYSFHLMHILIIRVTSA